MNVEYKKAISEVLEVLKHTRDEDVKKIPSKFLDFLEHNCSSNYELKNDELSISKMKLSSKAQALLGLIYIKYWATEPQKKKFLEKTNYNEQKYQEEFRKKYKINKLNNLF